MNGQPAGVSFQDLLRDSFCFGCGADNPDGLQLKSRWEGEIAVAEWTPAPQHAAGPRHILNGGIIATLLDCHGVCAAIASAYRKEGREIGSAPELWYATASLTVEYLRPTPLDSLIRLTADETEHDERTSVVECVLEAAGKPRACATVRAVRVPDSWRHGHDRPPPAR
ncbi:MAG: PaaI family thioesterase [Gaiella sp.]